ncbi:DMT family transporter [Pseudomonas sp. RIT-PI-AD]|uniref:DMT family transporter n=1 Tax=Pseudomonas sp. RIT-PI-AD TaxID=3035294 RepID=UPI0021D7E926|nr:DMT family transporter [Pseudomonas sp. RIT-PI-AD]
MSTYVLSVVLFAALLHAFWNALVKAGTETLFNTVLITSCAGLIAALALPWLPLPAPASWPYLGASVVAQVIYFALLAAAYRRGAMSQAYPLMRGSAPLLVALASLPLTGEALPVSAWLGIVAIGGGVLGLAGGMHNGAPRPVRTIALALLNATVIASYTLIDGLGVRLSASPAAYTLWIFLLTALPLLGWVLLRRPRAFAGYARRRLHLGLLGGAGTLASYGLALWAMTQAPIARVAALRETSILFAAAIAVLFLGETLSLRRLLATLLILAGAIALRLA